MRLAELGRCPSPSPSPFAARTWARRAAGAVRPLPFRERSERVRLFGLAGRGMGCGGWELLARDEGIRRDVRQVKRAIKATDADRGADAARLVGLRLVAFGFASFPGRIAYGT